MEIDLTAQLSSLAHPKRLALFRLLMRRYPDNVPAGEISSFLELKPNTASNYLSALRQVGLVVQSRDGTSLKYRANVATLQGVFDGLLEGCCQNRPDVCQRSSPRMPLVPSVEKPLKVLFLCSGNSARSILAEALLNSIGSGKFSAYSAGVSPAVSPHPLVLEHLSANGNKIAGLSSKSLETFASKAAPEMDFVLTVCDQAANEEPPLWGGQPVCAHWGLDDPLSNRETEADLRQSIDNTYQVLKSRIQTFVDLPFGELNHLLLQSHLDNIGQWDTTDHRLSER